jgi:alkylation response protein AidB-like acyl-CoA dehydrogenase
VAVVEALRGTAQRERWLPGILAGETVAALAVDEGRKHRPESISMQAERSGNGFKLTGQKRFVVQGASADVFVVAARAEEGLTLFTVEKDAAGLDVEGVRLADSSIGAGRMSTLAVQEGVQMHGGIGMTDEYDIGLYMKRDRVLNELFGDPNYHADKLARLKGY